MVKFISTALAHPRHQRRARSFQRSDSCVVVYGFDRGFYSANAFPPEVEVVQVGRLANQRYVRRLVDLTRGIVSIRRDARNRERPDLGYFFGLDAALLGLATLRRGTPFVYEIGDIRTETGRNFVDGVFRAIEDIVLARASVIVVTAPAFKKYLVEERGASADKIIVVENLVPDEIVRGAPNPEPVLSGRFRIGFVGVLRYARTLLPMIHAVGHRADRCEMHIYGDGDLKGEVQAVAQQYDNVFYHGPFQNPQDLASIYASIDLNYVVYDNVERNVRMALPNKLYESVFFGVPLIVSCDTQLAERVSEWTVGGTVDPQTSTFADDLLDSLSQSDLERWKAAAATVPDSALKMSDRWLSHLKQLTSESTVAAS